MPNQDYTESTQDLAVKTAGGRAVINRTWSWGRWYLNDAWADLSLRSAPCMSASPGQAAPIIAIGRAERIYKRVTAATLAAAQAQEEAAAAPLHPCLGAQQRLRFDHTGRLIENTLAGMQLMHVQRLDKNSEAITDARGQTTRIWYDSALTRRPVKIIWPDGSSESNEYDAAGRRIRHTSPLGVVSAWSYGERGQALTHTEAVGLPEERTWRWRYDSLGQRTQSTLGAKDGRGPDALTEHYAYDSWGNLTEMRDAAGHSSRASYNSQGLPLTHTDPEGRTTRYAWDAAGNLTSITNE